MQKNPVGCIPHKSVSRRVVARTLKNASFHRWLRPPTGEAGAGGKLLVVVFRVKVASGSPILPFPTTS